MLFEELYFVHVHCCMTYSLEMNADWKLEIHGKNGFLVYLNNMYSCSDLKIVVYFYLFV